MIIGSNRDVKNFKARQNVVNMVLNYHPLQKNQPILAYIQSKQRAGAEQYGVHV